MVITLARLQKLPTIGLIIIIIIICVVSIFTWCQNNRTREGSNLLLARKALVTRDNRALPFRQSQLTCRTPT